MSFATGTAEVQVVLFCRLQWDSQFLTEVDFLWVGDGSNFTVKLDKEEA